MGAWGVQLYQSDLALDVRDRFAVWSRIPLSPDKLVAAVAGSAADDRTDEDYPELWLALADQLHVYGLEHEEAFARAREIIVDGLDAATLSARGLSTRDSAKRAVVLEALLQRWTKPHPKPKRRKLLAAPEAHAFGAGTIVAYPTCGGEAANYADVKNRLGWFADGWGSALIVATGHELGWFAWSAAARLSVHGPAKPSLKQALAASIENQPWDMNPSGKGTLAVQIGSLSPLHAGRMGFISLGSVDLAPDKVAHLDAKFEIGIDATKPVPPATMHGVFTWWEPGVKPLRERRSDEISTPRGVCPVKSLCRPL